MPISVKYPLRNCKVCHKLFKPKEITHLYCSAKCRSKLKDHEYYLRNKEKIISSRRDYHRVWYLLNQEKYKKLCNQYYQKHKPEAMIRVNKRRARLIKADGSHSLREWKTLKDKFNFSCAICGRKEPPIKLTQDHIIPLCKGGSDFISNIQPLCQECNNKKFISLTYA